MNILFIASWLMVTYPLLEIRYFKYQLTKVKRGREDNAALSYDISVRAGEYMRTYWSLMGRGRKKFRRRLTVAGYVLATVYLITLFI